MPTRRDANFPRPTDSDEFETMLKDICAREWDDPGTKQFGRSGQAQMGIDVYGQPMYQPGVYRGVQCKLRTKDDRLSERQIETEITSARQFPFTLDTLILATDAPRDTGTQILVDRISEREVINGGFRVMIWFWEDITERIAAYPDLIVHYYKDFYAPLTALSSVERLIDCPIHIEYDVIGATKRTHYVVEALRLRGIRVTSTTRAGENFPDGVLCVLDLAETDDAATMITKYSAVLRSHAQFRDTESPIFALLPPDVMESFGQAAKIHELDLQRIEILELGQSVNDLADQIFKLLFRYGFIRRGGISTIEITARSHSRKPSSALLDLDWGNRLNPSIFPTSDEWDDVFVPAISIVREEILSQGDVTRIQISSHLPIPAAIAFGYYFNLRVARVGVWARKTGVSDFKQQFWLSDTNISRVQYQPKWFEQFQHTEYKTVILELTSYVSIHQAVQEFVLNSETRVDAWVELSLDVNGKPPENIGEDEAISFASHVGQVVRQLNSQGITTVHIFARIPSALGVLIGQRLISCGRIHLYWFCNPSYRFAFSLSDEIS